jgi:hypothetical protein
LDEPADRAWTVVVVASEAPAAVSGLLAGLRAHAPAGTQVVVVANDPSEAQQAALAAAAPDRAAIAGNDVEVLRTVTRLGYAAALNIGLRRAAGELVLLADASVRPAGDALTPLARALEDPDVAVAGAIGLTSSEPGRVRPAAIEPSEEREAGALLGAWLAFRRSDLIALGPLDERFVTPAWLDVWWSLRLRAGQEPELPDAGEPDAEEARVDAAAAGAAELGEKEPEPSPYDFELPAPRKAIRLDLPLERDAVVWPPDRSRLARRNMYRMLDRFGWRTDLF